MGLALVHPQEVEVFYILPALRREFAAVFKANGMAQAKIARLFGVTDSAVSQYLSDKRAAGIVFGKEIKEHIARAAPEITTQERFVFETQQLLNLLMETKATCKIHKQFAADLARDCAMCFER